MDWNERARLYPDEPLSEQEAQDYLGFLIDQHNGRPAPTRAGVTDGELALLILGLPLLTVFACWLFVSCWY